MNTIKRVIAILLCAVTVLFSMIFTVSADETATEDISDPASISDITDFSAPADYVELSAPEEAVVPDDPGIPDDPEIPDEPGTPDDPETPDEPGTPDDPEKPIYAEDTVALLYLCSNSTGFPSLGHIWIYFENVTENALKVGAYELPAGEGVSVGTFGLTRSDGFGIYYNVEAYTGNLHGMEKTLYLMTELDQSTFDKISKKILRKNWWDPIAVNCAFFAISIWNKGDGPSMFPWVVFPVFARTQMKSRGAKTDLKMFYPEFERVYKQKGSGDNARLVNVDPGTVDTPPG